MTPVAFKDYSAIEAVNWSTLKYMVHSPLHYRDACDAPGKDTNGRLKGRGTHTAVLEPERFLIDYALFKGKIRRGKEWDAFKAIHAEENILKRDEYDHCLCVAKAVRANVDARDILSRAKTEQTIEWTDEETGIRCKARLDILTDREIFDLKGVKSVDARLLGAEVARMMYHCQLAWYREGVRCALGKNLAAGLICVEHRSPHDVMVADADEEHLYLAWERVRELLNRVAECRKTGKWPGRHDGRQPLTLPAWAFDDDNDFDSVLSAHVVDENEEEEANA